MNKIEFEFWQSIKKGNGKAFLIIQKYPNINFDKFIWRACRITFAFDQQCEEVRGRYLFQFIAKAKNRKSIEEKVLKRLYKYNKSDWTMYQLFNISRIFGENGNQKAKEIMYLKLKKIVQKDKFWSMIDIFAGEVIEMDGERGLMFIAKIYGRMAKMNKEFQIYDDFLENQGLENSKEILERKERNNINVKYFMKSIRESDLRRQKYQENNQMNFSTRLEEAIYYAETKGYFPFSSFNKPTFEEIELVAEKVMNEKNIMTKSAYLRFFSGIKFPRDIGILIEMCYSNNEALREKSISALQHFRDKSIRDLFDNRIKKEKNKCILLELLINNYEKNDNILIQEIYSKEKDVYEKHGIASTIFDIYEKNKVKEGYEVLKEIYIETNCSSCRSRAIEIIKEINMLDKEIIDEGLYDSNSDVKELLKEHYSR